MIVSIHQPNFIPWIGYFYKIAKSDIFVILDDVDYTKNSFINRNRIKTPNGAQWLTIPVIHAGRSGQHINEVEIQFFEKNYRKIKSSLQSNYSKSKYYNEVISIFENYNSFNDNLAKFNEYFIRNIANYLGLKTKIIRSSDLNNIRGESTERLVSICSELQASSYLAGFGSTSYQDDKLFFDAKIKPIVYDFIHPIYNQLWGDFESNLSIVDLIMNEGTELFNEMIL